MGAREGGGEGPGRAVRLDGLAGAHPREDSGLRNVRPSMERASRLGTAALVFSLGLACANPLDPPPSATGLPPTAAAAPPAPASASLAAGAAPSAPGSASETRQARGHALGRARSTPMQALNQMLTAQALLVSLLLVPVSKDAGQAPIARLDDPAP